MDQVFDVAIIGGGINGCGCAADAAQRGLSVALFEQDDLASKTSSSSTKLIHGGLRYLEHYEFSLVKKALNERQTLLHLAPHLVQPQSFILPYQDHMRPAWFLRLGLFFYDHLSRKNRLPKCKYIYKTRNNPYFIPLADRFNRGFLFYDAATDDARLTLCNALQAKYHGAQIHPQSKVIAVQTNNNLWELSIQPKHGEPYKVFAKSLINAAGPWVNQVMAMTEIPVEQQMALIKGSHIVVPQLYEGQHAYFLQHTDKRIIFVIPFQGFSMIGTTDTPFSGSLDEVRIGEDEIIYLIDLVNAYFRVKINSDDILYTWSGIRPLIDEAGKKPNEISRDYHFTYNTMPAPIVTIYGGKITTYRQLAEEVVDQLRSVFPSLPASNTELNPLPGARFKKMNFEQYEHHAREKYHWMDADLLQRYLYTYGSQMEYFLQLCNSMNSLGEHFGSSLYQVEVDYLMDQEWAYDLDDILYRRTKLGLVMDEVDHQRLQNYLNANIRLGIDSGVQEVI